MSSRKYRFYSADARRSKLHIACSDFFKSQSALIALLLLSKSNPLRWASIWFWAQSRKKIDFTHLLQNHGNSLNFRGFAFAFCTFSGGLILRRAVDPSRDPYQRSERLGLESTGKETPHGVRRLFLHGCGDVGVGVQREPGGVVAQHRGQGFHVYSVLQGQN